MAQSLLRYDEVARLLATTKSHVIRLAREGELARVRVGRFWRINSAEVERFITKNQEARWPGKR